MLKAVSPVLMKKMIPGCFVNKALGLPKGLFPVFGRLRIFNASDGASQFTHLAAVPLCFCYIGPVTLNRLFAPCQEETPFTNLVILEFCIYSVSREEF